MITMLPGPSAVEEAFCGTDGALAAAGGVQPRLLLDCSTIDPPTALRVAEAAEASRLHPEVYASARPRASTSVRRALRPMDIVVSSVSEQIVMCHVGSVVWAPPCCTGDAGLQPPTQQSPALCAGRSSPYLAGSGGAR